MAYGTELILSFELKALERYLDEPISVLEDSESYLSFEEIVRPEVQRALSDAYLKLVRAHIDPAALVNDRDYVEIIHNGEKRDLSSFSLGVADCEGHNPVYGISLVSRYLPTWLDWDQQNGGSGNPIVLDDDALMRIELARLAIAPVIPEILEAPITFALVHY